MVRPEGEPFWVPTELLAEEMSSKIGWMRTAPFLKKQFNPKRLEGSLVEGRIIPAVSFVASHPTSILVRDIILGTKSLEAIRCENEQGRSLFGLPQISMDYFFKTYVDRVQRLIASVAAHGIRPIEEITGKPGSDSKRKDLDLGIAFVEKGLLFYRRGHHRLACALALNIPLVPVRCYFASASAVASVNGGHTEGDWRKVLAEHLEGLNRHRTEEPVTSVPASRQF